MLWRSDCQTRDKKAAGTKEGWLDRFEMLFWHCSKRVCQKFQMEDYNCHGAEYVLYKSSRVFSLFIFQGAWQMCFLYFSYQGY